MCGFARSVRIVLHKAICYQVRYSGFAMHCGRFLNVQPGFLTLSGAWKCVACGFANDVSKDNIID